MGTARNRIFVGIGVLGILIGAVTAWYTSSPLVTLHNDGSTNGSGYTITVYRNGRAALTCATPGRASSYRLVKCSNATVAPGSVTTSQFILDIASAGDVSQIRAASSCIKSASFGSVTTLTYRGATSGDISCGGYASRYSGIIDDADQMIDEVFTAVSGK